MAPRGLPDRPAGPDPGTLIRTVTDLEGAAALLGLEPKWLQPFDVEDPFSGLRLEGFLSIRPDHRYGALAILRVGGRDAPQRIFATPKLYYPFDRTGAFRFPPVKRIEIYEKLDGTNVLAYRYRDADGGAHVTYKLRLFPVLRNGKWGPFLDYWKEILERHPRIPELCETNGASVSFELYGSRNPHLILYDEPLASAVLFAVDGEGRPRPPSALQTLGVPSPRLVGTLAAGQDPVAEYRRIREELETGISEAEEERLRGAEGTVWYVTPAAGETILFKCKPESVEAIHWATGINKAAVAATCWNLLETHDVLSYETLLPLLLEEYEPKDIERFRQHVEECIASVSAELSFRRRVAEEYARTGLSLAAGKAGVMRALSSRFGRQDMKRVYSILSGMVQKGS